MLNDITDEEYYLLGRNAQWSGRSLLTSEKCVASVFKVEDVSLWNVDKFILVHTTSHPRRQYSPWSRTW